MSNRILTKAKFKKWLESKSPRTKVGNPSICNRCPIAKFLLQTTGKQYEVDGFGYCYIDDYDMYNKTLPEWAYNFINAVDGQGSNSVSAQKALRLLG